MSTSFVPPHHDGGSFCNPVQWGSYVDHTPLEYMLKVAPKNRKQDLFPVLTARPDETLVNSPKEDLQVTWLGHACMLVQAAAGVNILTDPAFSKRSSPVQFAGPARYTPPPCEISDLPPIHIVLISHNHYDHVDSGSIAALAKKEEADMAARPGSFFGTLWICPLGLKPLLVSCGAVAERVVELDWWDSFVPASATKASSVGPVAGVTVDPAASKGALLKAPDGHHDYSAAALSSATAVDFSEAAVLSRGVVDRQAAKCLPRIVAIPAQHQSARSGFDRNKTLWCGFVVITPAKDGFLTRFLFTGDTGYRAVPEGVEPLSPEEDRAISCPAFKFVGQRFGPIDIAALPIGAFSPRFFMSSVHCSPADSVEIHKDIRAIRAFGMHWGTFPLTDEPILEPPAALAAAVKHKGLKDDAFVAVYPGATIGIKGGVFDKRLIATPSDVPVKA